MTVRDDRPHREIWPERLAYSTGMLLDETDFSTEQSYHRSRLARALFYLHGHGTIGGLNVVFEEGPPRLVKVQPGLAVDRIGRLVEVPEARCLRIDHWYKQQAEDAASKSALENSFTLGAGGTPDSIVTDVFLGFRECERGKRPAFATGNFDALDAVGPSRLRDSYELTMITRPASSALPVPERNLPDLGGGNFEARRGRLDEAKRLDGWLEDTLWDPNDQDLIPGPEHLPGQNPSDLLLARLMIPSIDGTPPTYNTSVPPPDPDNSIRAMAYSAADLLALIKSGS